MRITTKALLPLSLLVGLSSGAWAQNPRSYQAKYTATPPKIDGVVAAGEWDAATLAGNWGVLRLDETAKDKENARFRILWDNQFLYLLFQSDYKNWSAGIGNDATENVPGTQNQGISFGDDNLNIYFDPNTDAEENQRPDGEVDGYQLAWNQRQGTGSFLNGKFVNTGLFLEGHINTPFGNQAKWQGFRKSSFVQIHGNSGGVVELALAWEDIDSPNQTGAEWADALDSFPEDGSLWHPFSPKNGDKWIFNISRITSDASNLLPIWSWHGAQGFAVAPHGTLEFTGRPETNPLAWYKINSVTVDTPEPPFDTYLGENLIQGPGVGFEDTAPYNQLGGGGTHRWVTVACGFPCDYLTDRPTPKLIFDLGQDRTLGSVDLWGYAATNANGVKKLKIRFATAADGAKGFGKSIAYSPSYELPNDDVSRMPRVFTQKVKARYVEIECLDNYFVEPGNTQGHPLIKPGGDRVGLGEVAFPVTAEDAQLLLPAEFGQTVDGFQDDFTSNTRNSAWIASPPDKDEYVPGNGVLKVTVVGEGAFDTHLLYKANYSDSAQEVLARIRMTNFGTGDPARAGLAVGVDEETSQGINLHFRDNNQDGVEGRQFKLLDDRRAWGPAGLDIDWEDNTWYWVRLKQTSDNTDNGDNVLGKVWLANGAVAEPKDWQMTWSRGGRTGLAGLVGSSIGGISEYEVDYILIKAAGLPKITPAASAFSGVVVAPPKASLSASAITREALTLEYTDAGTSVFDTASVKLKIDGKDVTPTVAAAGGKTTITYKPSPIFDTASAHTFDLSAKDKAGAAISDKGELKLPTPVFPDADLAGPKPVKDAWGTRFIFDTGESVTGIKNIFRLIDAAPKAGFPGTVVDVTLKTINFGDAGYFADSPGYPAAAEAKGCCGEDFINLNIAHLKVTEAGQYTFGVHSDDGFGLRIKGAKFLSKSGDGSLDRADPSVLVHPADTGDSRTRGVAELGVGVYRIEFFWWERGGGDHGEIYVAKGAFKEDADTDTWKLVGDPTSSIKLTDEPVTTGGAAGGSTAIAVWKFDGDAKDSSGNGLDGTVTGATFSDDVRAGATGKSIQFKANTDLVQVAHNAKLDITTALTISAWVKPIGNTAWDGILAKNPSDGSGANHAGNYELRIENGSRKPTFLYQRGAKDDTATLGSPGAAVVPVGVWSHLAVTATKGGDAIFYLNGEEIGKAAVEATFGVTNTSPLYIGTRADKFTNMDGLLDDVALYGKALTAQEVKALAGTGGSGTGSQSGSRPNLISQTRYAAGAFGITLQTTAGAKYDLEYSQDLKTWTVINADVAGTGQPLSPNETDATRKAQRAGFYRVRVK